MSDKNGQAPEAMKPISLRDRLSVWTKPIGEVIYFHLVMDSGLVDLIWLIEGHKALRLGRRLPKRLDPPLMQKVSKRIHQFAELARVEFTDTEARAVIDKLVEDVKEINRFRNTLAHGRWAGFSDEQLNLFFNNELVEVTREAMDARGRKAFELSHDRLGSFQLWVMNQNAGLTRRQKQRAIIPIIHLLRARAAAGSPARRED